MRLAPLTFIGIPFAFMKFTSLLQWSIIKRSITIMSRTVTAVRKVSEPPVVFAFLKTGLEIEGNAAVAFANEPLSVPASKSSGLVMLRVEEIIVPSSVSVDYDANGPYNSLRDIRRLNAIVGPNNSGKSRLMRALFLDGSDLLMSTSDEHARRCRELVRRIASRIPETNGDERFNEHLEKIRTFCFTSQVGFHRCGQHLLPNRDARPLVQSLSSGTFRLVQKYPEHRENLHSIATDLKSIELAIEGLDVKSRPDGRGTQPEPPVLQNAEFVYIPTLRGMRLGTQDENLKFAYFDRTWADYIRGKSRQNQSRAESIEHARAQMSGKTVFTGLDLYDVLTDRLLGSLADRRFIRQYEEYLSSAFFQGQPVALIPRREHDTVNIKIGNEAERPVQSLGDGLQQVIILTLPMFGRQDGPLFLFIEEPDLFLHPGYQRALIDVIFHHRNPQLYVFVTTHSNQLLDVTISEEDCSIFRCSKQPSDEDNLEHNPKFSVSNATFGDYELLKHIGLRPSSVMFANCTIWVEGITDRLYYGRFLQLVLEERNINFIENMHYAFVEYGGGNITHWSFLDEETGMDVERICARLFLIADKDDGKDGRHAKLQAVLGERFHRIDVREVENLLVPSIISAVIRSYESGEVKLQDFSETAYRNNYLGKFIDDRVLVDKTKSKRYRASTDSAYADESGTVKNKLRFCQKALSHIKSVSDLSDAARTVAEKLADFVLRENQ